jgi:hypothetical protein
VKLLVMLMLKVFHVFNNLLLEILILSFFVWHPVVFSKWVIVTSIWKKGAGG